MIAQIYSILPTEVWIVLFAPVVVFIVNRLKNLLGAKKFDIVIHVLTITTSWLVVYLPTVIEHVAKPLPLLGAYTAGLFTVANLLYAGSKAVKIGIATLRANKLLDAEKPAETAADVPVTPLIASPAETAADW